MSKHQTKAFLKLQKAWYKKLAKSGFEEAEDVSSPREMLKRWHSSWFKSRMTPDQFKAKETYFQNAAWFLEHHIFETSRDKRAWSHHADGLSLAEIAKKLKVSRSTAYIIIAKLKEVLNANKP